MLCVNLKGQFMEANQLIFNIIFGVAGTLSVFVMTAIWSKLNALEKNDRELTTEISKLHILVSGEYVKKSEIAPQLSSIFEELRHINKELAHKIERRTE
jgi:hypothetical protein